MEVLEYPVLGAKQSVTGQYSVKLLNYLMSKVTSLSFTASRLNTTVKYYISLAQVICHAASTLGKYGTDERNK